MEPSVLFVVLHAAVLATYITIAKRPASFFLILFPPNSLLRATFPRGFSTLPTSKYSLEYKEIIDVKLIAFSNAIGSCIISTIVVLIINVIGQYANILKFYTF